MHIKCVSCRFVRIDKVASEKNWTAYECGNPDSEYHMALLNISVDGNKLKRITWSGCACGERKT